jgi:hypothetical protein
MRPTLASYVYKPLERDNIYFLFLLKAEDK